LQFSEEYEETITALEKFAKTRSKAELLSKLSVFTETTDVDYNGRFANICRSRALQTKSIITEEKYPVELYKLFRNGYSEEELKFKEERIHNKYKITKSMVRCSANRYFAYKKTLDDISKQKSVLINTATDVIRKFENMESAEFVSTTRSNDYDINYAFMTFGKKKAAQLTNMCNIYTMAFSAKIEAIKEAYIQDRKVCFMAISNILTGDND
jgi:hypothetical protein